MNTMTTRQSPPYLFQSTGVDSVRMLHNLELALQRMSNDQLLHSRDTLLRLSRDLKQALREEREILEALAQNIFSEEDGAALSYILEIIGQVPSLDSGDGPSD